jgi:hypothetical protein
MHVAGVGNVSLITIIDVVSRLKVESYPCLDTTNPPFSAYQLMLRRAFLTTGLPRRISLDHGTVFYDNTSASPFPTRLHLWLLADGASTSASSASAVPLTTPKLSERTKPWRYKRGTGHRWPDQTALWVGLDTRRAMLNQHIPSWVLHGHAPLQAYPEAAHSGRSYCPEWEAEMLDLDRVFAYLANCRWFRHVRANGRLDLGGYDYYLGTTWRSHLLELRFDASKGASLGNQ